MSCLLKELYEDEYNCHPIKRTPIIVHPSTAKTKGGTERLHNDVRARELIRQSLMFIPLASFENPVIINGLPFYSTRVVSLNRDGHTNDIRTLKKGTGCNWRELREVEGSFCNLLSQSLAI